MSNIMPQATNLISLIEAIKAKFHQAKPDHRNLKPDLVTLADEYLAARHMSYIDRCLYEFDTMTINYSLDIPDRAVLGGLIHDEAQYLRKQLSFTVRAILYGQYTSIPANDIARIEARHKADQAEQAA